GLAQGGGVFLDEDVAEGPDLAERLLQVVGGDEGEALQFLVAAIQLAVGPSQLGRAFADVAFEFVVGTPQGVLGLALFGDVGAGADPLADLAAGLAHGDAVHEHAAIDPVAAAEAAFDAVIGGLAVEGVLPGGHDALAVALVDGVEPAAVGRLLGGLAGEVAP